MCFRLLLFYFLIFIILLWHVIICYAYKSRGHNFKTLHIHKTTDHSLHNNNSSLSEESPWNLKITYIMYVSTTKKLLEYVCKLKVN